MKWSAKSSRQSAGAGWSMLALKSSNTIAYRLDIETNERCFLEITPLSVSPILILNTYASDPRFIIKSTDWR